MSIKERCEEPVVFRCQVSVFKKKADRLGSYKAGKLEGWKAELFASLSAS
jgi:hypothetical protein